MHAEVWAELEQLARERPRARCVTVAARCEVRVLQLQEVDTFFFVGVAKTVPKTRNMGQGGVESTDMCCWEDSCHGRYLAIIKWHCWQLAAEA